MSLSRASQDMEPKEDSVLRFHSFIQSFQCEKIPCDLLVRACEPKLTWSSSGGVVERLPLEAGVPGWLIDFYNINKPFLHHATHVSHIAGVEIILENGVPYFEVATASQPEPELNQLSSIANERSMAEERLAAFLQAFPSINIEIIGEEIVDRLMIVATRSILPLLSCLTDGDIRGWLLPKGHDELKSYLFSLFEFLYHVIAILGIEHPLLPLSLPERILNIAPRGTGNESVVALQKIADILKHFKDDRQDLLESKLWSSGPKADERSHAILGYLLSLLDMHVAEALTTWQPLLSKSPSQMEYLAAISFCEQSRLAVLEKPAFPTLDTRVSEGLLRSRRKQYDQAAKALEATMVEVISQYGPCSLQVGIATAELANCYNVLRREALAELTLTKSLELRLDSSLSNRRDGIYLRLALADSFIGQAKYQDAVPILQRIIDDPDVSATFRMMSALRLTRSRRRMHEAARKAFEHKSPLWIGFSLLDNVPDVLVMEYIEELGCSISELPKQKLKDSKDTQELIEAVNSALGISSSVTNNPCWDWYTKCQQGYLGQIANATKADKGKGVDGFRRNEDPDRMGTPISPGASSCRPPQSVDDMSLDEGPWSERLVISFDGGGVRAISSLLILKRIMHQIQVLEFTHPDGPSYSSSDSSWSPGDKGDTPLEIPEWSATIGEFLPCHYFDYVAGVSTGGLNSIMLGSLRMSVDQAIDNFIKFGNAVLGRPRLFHSTSPYLPSRTKYPAADVRRAFQNIITDSIEGVPEVGDVPGWGLSGHKAMFHEKSDGIRTIVFSCRLEDGLPMPYAWKSYLPQNYTRIWEVACATSASPGYFDAIEIDGDTYLDGSVIGNNPSIRALREVCTIHTETPAVFVNIGTCTQDGNDTSFGSDLWSDRRWRDRIQQSESLLERTGQGFQIENEMKLWMGIFGDKGHKIAYRLSAGKDLQAFPDYGWHPADTGKKTVHEITRITEEYLRNDEAGDIIAIIAHEAVRIRRARAITEKWRSFIQPPAVDPPSALSSVGYNSTII